MRITNELLKQLGCKPVPGRVGCFELHSRGYAFYFEHYKRKNVSGVQWAFHVCQETFDKGWNYGHCVTDIEECFGMIAEDLFDAGRKERSTEIRELLGIKTEGEYDD